MKSMTDKKFDWDTFFGMENVELIDPSDMEPDERREYIEMCCKEYLRCKEAKITKLEDVYGQILSGLIKLYGN